MREQPTAVELIEAVAEFLQRDVQPALSGRLAFHARVAANVLDIVRRELMTRESVERLEAERLRSLLGHDGDLESLNDELCDGLASGAVDANARAVIDHLWATTLDTGFVDQPKYGTFRRALDIIDVSDPGTPAPAFRES